jgi:hypothetical protein
LCLRIVYTLSCLHHAAIIIFNVSVCMFDQEIFRKNYTLTIQQVGQRLQSKVLLLETLRIVTERLYHSDMLTMSKITLNVMISGRRREVDEHR